MSCNGNRMTLGRFMRIGSANALALALVFSLSVDSFDAFAKGGTARPPAGGGGGGGAPPVGACPTTGIVGGVTACIVPPAGPVLPNFPAPGGASPLLSSNQSNGFAITGFIQNLTVTGDPTCATTLSNQARAVPVQSTFGGTVTVNGIIITIPTNTIVQYPANTLTWADAVCGVSAVGPAISVDGTGGTPRAAGSPRLYPGVEISLDGNIVAAGAAAAGAGNAHVAALVHINQQSTNSGSGYISFIDYTDGSIYVSNSSSITRLLINDPRGRFSQAQSSVDARFSVDDANPTIKAAATGYPMCVPRDRPNGNAVGTGTYSRTGGFPDDPDCPQINRPRAGCRIFADAGVTFRVAGDLPRAPGPGGFCNAFVMKALSNMPGTGSFAAASGGGGAITDKIATPGSDPDPRLQAPFEVGDFITWQGTLVRGGAATAPAPGLGAPAPTTTDIIWVHTIDANVGIYTQPGTLPAYIAIGEMGIGIDPVATTVAAALPGVESTARIFLESSTSDIASIVDIYMDDKGFSLPVGALRAGFPACLGGPCVVPDSALAAAPATPNEYFRWITPETMTGTLADQAGQPARGVTVPSQSVAQASAFGGGIYTQFIGPQPGRARIRANKVPQIDANGGPCAAGGLTIGGSQGCAVTQSPTRYVRAVLRSLCAPAASGTVSSRAGFPVVPSKNLDTGARAIDGTPGAVINSGAFFDINGFRPDVTGAGPGSSGVGHLMPVRAATPVVPAASSCLESAQFANGLYSGQYMAPVGEYIFPENTLAGFPVIPNNFWHMGFLVYGENGKDGNSTSPQVSRPW